MVSGGLSIVREIVLPQNSRAALVVVHCPRAVTGAADVVHVTVADDGAQLLSQRVNRAEVAQLPQPQMVEVAVFNEVSAGNCRCVTPGPADADCAVVKVSNIAVANRTIARME